MEINIMSEGEAHNIPIKRVNLRELLNVSLYFTCLFCNKKLPIADKPKHNCWSIHESL